MEERHTKPVNLVTKIVSVDITIDWEDVALSHVILPDATVTQAPQAAQASLQWLLRISSPCPPNTPIK